MQDITPSHGSVVLRNYEANFGDGTTQSSFGLINEVKLNYKALAASRDSKGRTFVPGYDVEVTFKMMQTDAATLGYVFTAMTNDAPDRLRLIKGTTGFEFMDVKPIFEPELDGAGGVNAIKVKVDTMLTNDEMNDILYSG